MGKRVLCVEDEHFISELYQRALTKAGYDVKVVFSGPDGLKEAQTNSYDIILLDIMVPEMSGIEVLRTLRRADSSQPISAKIIITTNLDQEEETKSDIETMADGYLIKAEITPRQLVEFLQNL